MIRVLIEEDELLDMLIERVEHWTNDPKIIALYSDMYENYIDNGVFDDSEINIMQLVDNDYINYCQVLYEGEDIYDAVNRSYLENGIGECYDDDGNYLGYIEAENNGIYLIRY